MSVELTQAEIAALMSIADEVDTDDLEEKAALGEIAEAIRSVKLDIPAGKETDLKPVIKALAEIGGITEAITETHKILSGLRGDVQSLASTLKKIEPSKVDLMQVVKAMDKNTAALTKLVETMSAPKRLIRDRNGDPVGIEIDAGDE